MRVLPFFPLPVRQVVISLALAWPLLTACSSGGTDAADTANAQNEQAINNADVTEKQEADAEFLVKATSNALLEVELGKLAQAKANTPAVRSYGTQLLQDRLALLASLRALADAKKLTLPPALGNDEQAAYHEVSTQAGTQLDKQLMALLVKTQQQDEDAFDDMKDDAYDGDIRGFAAKFLPPVKEQLEGGEKIAEAIEDLP